MIQASSNRVETLEQLMKLSKDDQKRHLNYLARSSIEVRLALFEKQKEIFHPLLQKYKGIINISDLTYAALILAIGSTRSLEKKLTQKSFSDLSLDEIRDLSSMRAVAFKQQMKKGSQKHEKLLGYWAIVRSLRLDHGYSYERIALYLQKKHRFSIAPSTVMKKWKEMETQNMENAS